MRHNFWTDHHDGHVKAARLGWTRRKSPSVQSGGEIVKLTPAQRRYLTFLRSQVEEGEQGKRVPSSTGEWIGYGSSYPDWMRNQGWTKEVVLKVFDRLEKGGWFPQKNIRQLHIADSIKDEASSWARKEGRRERVRKKVMASAKTAPMRSFSPDPDWFDWPEFTSRGRGRVSANPSKGYKVIARIGTYTLRLGKREKKATVVRFMDGAIVRFTERIGNREAYKQAVRARKLKREGKR